MRRMLILVHNSASNILLRASSLKSVNSYISRTETLEGETLSVKIQTGFLTGEILQGCIYFFKNIYKQVKSTLVALEKRWVCWRTKRSMDELLHSPLVRFHYGWHNICRSMDALCKSSLQYREILIWVQMVPVRNEPETKRQRFKPQTLQSQLRQQSKQINTRIVDSWQQKNLCWKPNLPKWLNSWLILYQCCSQNTFKRTKCHKNVNYSTRCHTALNDGFHECCCWKHKQSLCEEF